MKNSSEPKTQTSLNEERLPTNESQSPSLNISQYVSLCAIGLLVSFFLPWTNVLGKSISGFDLQRMGANQKWLWLIPVFCLITIFAGTIKRSQKIAAQLAGALPYVGLIYWLNQLGSDLLRALSFGAWLSLFFGLALFILPRRLK